MTRSFLSLTLAAALLSASACQKAADGAATTGDATVVENHTADTGDGMANSSANPDTLPGATATASAAMVSDSDFMVKAASSGLMEVEAAKQAQKSGDATVKGVADMILKDHTKANTELMALAAKKNVKLPAMPIDDAKTTLDKLMAANGQEFNRMYLEEMNMAHDKDIALFEAQSKNGKDADVRAFAEKTLPALRAHAGMIKKNQKTM